jgi:hypothetical protein
VITACESSRAATEDDDTLATVRRYIRRHPRLARWTAQNSWAVSIITPRLHGLRKFFSVDEFLVGNLVTTENDSMVSSSYQSDSSHTERATTSSWNSFPRVDNVDSSRPSPRRVTTLPPLEPALRSLQPTRETPVVSDGLFWIGTHAHRALSQTATSGLPSTRAAEETKTSDQPDISCKECGVTYRGSNRWQLLELHFVRKHNDKLPLTIARDSNTKSSWLSGDCPYCEERFSGTYRTQFLEQHVVQIPFAHRI